MTIPAASPARTPERAAILAAADEVMVYVEGDKAQALVELLAMHDEIAALYGVGFARAVLRAMAQIMAEDSDGFLSLEPSEAGRLFNQRVPPAVWGEGMCHAANRTGRTPRQCRPAGVA